MKKNEFIPKGKIFIETFYGDRENSVYIYKALKDINPKLIRVEFLGDSKKDTTRNHNIVDWIISKGYAEEVEFDTLHINGYHWQPYNNLLYIDLMKGDKEE